MPTCYVYRLKNPYNPPKFETVLMRWHKKVRSDRLPIIMLLISLLAAAHGQTAD